MGGVVHLGSASAKVREQLWAIVTEHIDNGSAVVCWPNVTNPTGVGFKAIEANRRRPVELDGLLLVQFDKELEVEVPCLVYSKSSVDLTALKNSSKIK